MPDPAAPVRIVRLDCGIPHAKLDHSCGSVSNAIVHSKTKAWITSINECLKAPLECIYNHSHLHSQFISTSFTQDHINLIQVTMANPSETTRASSVLGKWIEELYDRIFVQPDDQISAHAFENDLAHDFVAR